MSDNDEATLRSERIRRYQENAARERAAAERATDPAERQRLLRLESGWKRLESIEKRHDLLEALLQDAYNRQGSR
jgi:hypothetical protein